MMSCIRLYEDPTETLVGAPFTYSVFCASQSELIDPDRQTGKIDPYKQLPLAE